MAEDRDGLPVGCQLGDFHILERIGGGPTSEVYRARQLSADRAVVLKLLAESLAENEAAVSRFLAEAAAAGAVRHPNVVDVFFTGCAERRHFIAMELVQGETLASLLERDGRVPADRAMAWMREVAEALAAVHVAGFIHGDVQPSNILLGPGAHAKLTDFGLTRPLDPAAEGRPMGAPLEAPLYYPPEAARARPLDQRSDLFLLGGTFYHALAGRPPFEADSLEESALLYARRDVPPLNAVLPAAPVALCRVIDRLLARNPDDRYPSAAQVAEVLGRLESLFSRTRAARASAPVWSQTTREDEEAEEPPERPTLAERAEAIQKRQKQALILSGVSVLVMAIGLLLALVVSRGGREPSTEGALPPLPPEVPTVPVIAPSTAARAPKPLPVPKPPPAPEPVVLRAAQAAIHGREARYEVGGGKDNIGFWFGDDAWVSWDFEATAPGTYEVEVVFAAERGCDGNLYVVAVGTETVTGKVRNTGGWTAFVPETIGTLTLAQQGKHTLSVRVLKKPSRGALFNLQSVTLRPVGAQGP